MKTERQKMISEEWYHPLDKELAGLRKRARHIFKVFNQTPGEELQKQRKLLRELIPEGGENAFIEPPFHCDYGLNIHLSGRVFFNFDCVVLDSGSVTIGKNVLIGPKSQIYTVVHPKDVKRRRSLEERAYPVRIGNDVWIGGGAIICPGVKIGSGAIVGAGSVVIHDVPKNTFVAGNPAKAVHAVR